VTSQAPTPGPAPSRTWRVWAVVLIGLSTGLGALRLFLVTRSVSQTIAIIALIVVLISALASMLSAGTRRAAEQAMARDPGVLASIVGTPLEGIRASGHRAAAHRQKPVIVSLFADRIVIRPLRERVPTRSQTIFNREISAADWAVVATGSRPLPRLHLTSGGRDLSVLFDPNGQRRQVVQFRETLARVMPLAVRGAALPTGSRGVNQGVIAAVVAGTVLGTGAVPLTTRVAMGSGTAQVDGYQTFFGVDHRNLLPGRPWGRVCTPVVIQLDPTVPETIRALAETVVDQARTGGANLTLANPDKTFDSTQLRLPAKGEVVFVPIYAQANGGTKPDGQPLRFQATWHSQHDLDGRHDVLTSLKGDLYTDPLAGDPVTTRKALRAIIARSAGVEPSTTSPGTGLGARPEESTDRFSTADLHALRVLSGCSSR
jgi:hypothetical protein